MDTFASFLYTLNNVKYLFTQFESLEIQALGLIEANLPLAAYELVLKASHTFNLLDSRGAVSVTERQRIILRIRKLAQGVATTYYTAREALGWPLLKEEQGSAQKGEVTT